jgi:hypothetical protein
VITVSKSYHYLKSSFCFLLMCVGHNFYGQADLLLEAEKLCSEKKFEQAIPVIDKVILHPETKDNPASWHIRSYSYIQTFKQIVPLNFSKINLIDTAMVSVLRSMKLDTAHSYLEYNNSFVKSGAGYYYRAGAMFAQDSLNNVKSELYYLNYRKYILLCDPTFDIKQKDIEHYKNIGGIFADLYSKSNFNPKYGDIAKTALLKVLELDPKNISANINLGILYYNQGATLMQMMEYDVDLAQLDVFQENAKKLFKQSLPFMIKVYELDPKAERALEGLQGIYSALLDDEKANEFKQRKEALKNK